MYVWVSESKKCPFFGQFFVRNKWIIRVVVYEATKKILEKYKEGDIRF